MFTGIITDIGNLLRIEGEQTRRLVIGTAYDTTAIKIGASIACNGVCLTVTERGEGWFAVDASPTTLAVTTMGRWTQGERINLERALRLTDELGGHMVSGHVDAIARIEEMSGEASRQYTLSCPSELAAFIAAKGSVTLDGVSLTVTWVKGSRFGLTLIPHTLAVTNWSDKRAGDTVNIEVDMLARYVARLQEKEEAYE